MNIAALPSGAPQGLGGETDLALVPDRENADLIFGNHESVQGDVSGMTVGNYQLTQFAFEASSYQRVCGKVIDRGLDRSDSILCGIRIFIAQESEGALDVFKGSRRIDYRCHGFGLWALPSSARRCIQAWTSPAR
jgi:hypothetical protein